MILSKHADFNIPEAGDALPSIANRSDYIMAQRNNALALVEEAAGDLTAAYQRVMKAVASVQLVTRSEGHAYRYSHRENTHYTNLFNETFDAGKAVEAFRKAADTDIWQALIKEAGVEQWMDHQALKEFHSQLATDVPEVSPDNLKATFETLFSNRRTMFLRGMANVFSNLDRRFKSHDAFKVGSRIILSRITGYSGGFCRYGEGATLLNDVDRCLRKVLGLPDNPGYLVQQLDALQGRTYGPKRIDFECSYLKLRIFLNGNAHCYLSRDAAERVNLALAEYYGDVVPDAAPADMDCGTFRERHANLPSKDLAFYPTPDEAADRLVGAIHLWRGMKVLEPSAGTGALIRAIRREIAKRGECPYDQYRLSESDVSVDAIEIHPSRAAQLRHQEGDFCTVTVDNFLSRAALPVYDAVVCNPPFAGTHFMGHITRALDHLKPGGVLVAILPVTAELGESPKHARFHRWLERESDSFSWRDLPAGSFETCGTMINTTILKLKKRS